VKIRYLNVTWHHTPIAVELIQEFPQHWLIESLEGAKPFQVRVHKSKVILFDTYADACAHLQMQQRVECDQ
jgi:hypothetical protein